MSAIFRSPVASDYPRSPGGALSLTDESTTHKLVVRANDGTAAQRTLDQAFGGSRAADGVLIAGTRPNEWMLLGSVDDVSRWIARMPTEGHVSLVDWTHARAQFRLSGAAASSALEKVCSLDWSDHMMPNGAATSGSVAKVTCDLVRNDIEEVGSTPMPSYLVLCDRSFGQYLFDVLIDAGNEFGISIHTLLRQD